MIAHVAGAPLEEALLPLLSGLSAVLLLARARLLSALHRRRPRPAPPHDDPPA